MQIVLRQVTLSFPHLFEAKAIQGSTKAKFSAAFILDKKKDAAQIQMVQDAIERLIKEEKLRVAPDKRCLKDGSSKPEHYTDSVMFINASNDVRPQVVNRNKTPVVAADNLMYAGAVVDAVLHLWGQNNQYGQRVNASLEVVRFVAHGEPIGRKPVDVDEVLPDLDSDGLD